MKNNPTSSKQTKQLNMDKKEKIKFWLNRGCIHYLINWNANLDCFGNKINFDPRF